jgi:hypothetical protein
MGGPGLKVRFCFYRIIEIDMRQRIDEFSAVSFQLLDKQHFLAAGS